MRVRKHLSVIFSLTFLLTFVIVGAEVSAAQAEVTAQHSGTQVAWSSSMQYQQAVLTVSLPDGSVVKRTFEAGAALNFSVLEASEGGIQDGIYAWELVFSPVSEDGKPLERTEASEKAASLTSADMKGSGYFRVLNGALVNRSAVAEKPFQAAPAANTVNDSDVSSTTKDQQFLDDVIIDGSLCVGFDCVNGESFGFDTIRMKENNIRIKAQDTSTSASFPSRDWQITFNETTNGGANKFSIDDIDGGRTPFTIEAGAPSHSLFVDDGGRVGFGTNVPVADLHVKSGNTPTLRLEQDGSSGFTAQTWDLAGNEANFFLRDATNGSTLPFRVFPGAPSNALSIEATGDIGLGTTSPDSNLDIESGTPGMRFTNTGSAGGGYRFQMNGTQGTLNWRDLLTNNDFFKISQNVNAGLFRLGADPSGTDASDTVGIDGVLSVNGSIVVNGTTVHSDFVFDQSYHLESISDHAEFMWREKHLPALPKAPEGLRGPVDLVSHQMAILEELEKAHIYIEQLSKTIENLESRLETLEQ